MAKTMEEARNKVSETMGRYTDLASGGATIADVLKEKALKAFDNNQDIVKPLDEATASYYSAPSTAREKYQGIFNPFSREKLVSEYTNNASLPMLMYANLYGNRMGRIDDLINSGTNAYKAEVTSAEGAANTAQKEYENILKEYELNQKYAGADNNDMIASAIMSLLSGGGGTTPTEEAPMYSPVAGLGSMSEGGQWNYTDKGWTPNQQSSNGGISSLDPISQLLLTGAISKGDYSTAQKILGGGNNQLDFSKVMTLANYGKPTATQETDAINARSALADLKKLEKLSGISSGKLNSNVLMGSNAGFLARLTTPQIRQYQDAAKNVYDVITRTRTGAALNLDEQTFYSQFVPQSFDDITTAKVKIQRLKNLYQSVVQQAENPYQSLLDTYMSNFASNGSDWEIVE
jgi:hypothetical protein